MVIPEMILGKCCQKLFPQFHVMSHLSLAYTGDDMLQSQIEVTFCHDNLHLLLFSHFSKVILWRYWIRMIRVLLMVTKCICYGQ